MPRELLLEADQGAFGFNGILLATQSALLVTARSREFWCLNWVVLIAVCFLCLAPALFVS